MEAARVSPSVVADEFILNGKNNKKTTTIYNIYIQYLQITEGA